MSGNFMYRHHVEPRVKLHSPREDSFLIPLNNIDFSRTTNINLDVMQESRIDDYWIIDGSRDLSDSCGPVRDWQNGLRHPGPIIYGQNSGEEWQGMLRWGRSRNGQLKNQSSTMLEDDEESISLIWGQGVQRSHSECWKHGKQHWLPPCLTRYAREASMERPVARLINDFKSKFACILEASESTRMRTKESLSTYHEDHLAGKGTNSLQHYNLVHKFFSYASNNEDTRSKRSSRQRMGEIWKDSGVGRDNSQKRIRGDP